jgi:chloride channel 7
MMLVLTCAKFTADLFTPSFDHAMLHLQKLPFLDEEPPHEFDVLTARDVMARKVIVLRQVETVGDLVAVLRRTEHNGFPIVDTGRHHNGAYFTGLILRRQLLVILHERVWELQGKPGFTLSPSSRNHFVDSAFASPVELLSLQLGKEEKEALIDLRPFMDPSPYVVTELMPLRRVYRFFNEIGVRHLAVVDRREQVVGIITRKDVLPEHIEEHVLGEEHLREVQELLGDEHPSLPTPRVLASSEGRPGSRKGSAQNTSHALHKV